MAFRLCITALLGLCLAACARVAPPQPPLKRLPPAPQAPSGQQEGSRILVRCELPATNTDGSAITGYKQVEITGVLRRPGEKVITVPAQASPLVSLTGTDLAGRIDQRHFRTAITDMSPLLPGGAWPDARQLHLFIRFQNERSHWSPYATVPPFPIGKVAAPVAVLTLTMDRSGVQLSWPPPATNFDESTPPRWDGTMVERRLQPDGAPEPIGKVKAGQTTFTDTTFVSDTRYGYAVSFFRIVAGGTISSGRSPWQDIVTRDVFAPMAPGNLSAVIEEGRIRLLWNPVLAQDLAGYLVFREDPPATKSIQLTPDPVPGPSYVDPTADPSRSHIYRVMAVDTHGNRSPLSDPVVYQPETVK